MLHETVRENIVYPLKIRKQKICEEEIDFYLNEFGIFEKKFEHARQLSSGQQQKVSIIARLSQSKNSLSLMKVCQTWI